MDVIFRVFLIFVGAVVFAEALRPLRVPVIVAELSAGVVLGPHVLGWIKTDDATSILASLGIIVLMFQVGLELRVTDLVRVGRPALGASVLGVVVSLGAVTAVVAAFGHTFGASARAGVALAATSAGIGARVLTELGVVKRRASRVVLGAAVLDDMIVLIVLSVVLSAGTSRSAGSIAFSLGAAMVFIALVSSLGPWLARRHGPLLARLPVRVGPVVLALVICLGLAALADRIGLAALVGAFLAGMVLAETREHVPLEDAMRPLSTFLVPFFFVLSGARIDLSRSSLGLAAALAAVAIAAKLAGSGLGAFGLSRRERIFVGAAMVPRGEVTIAAASAAFSGGKLYGAIVAAVFVSALVGPILVRMSAPGTVTR